MQLARRGGGAEIDARAGDGAAKPSTACSAMAQRSLRYPALSLAFVPATQRTAGAGVGRPVGAHRGRRPDRRCLAGCATDRRVSPERSAIASG